MSTLNNLENQAVMAAKKGQWTQAISFNQEILEKNATDVGALNRLGFAYLQTGQTELATQTFQQVLTLEKSNTIALRQLDNIAKNDVKRPEFASENFVEEPSKSKIIGLLRLADKQILEGLVVGQEVTLKLKSRFISVETLEKVYLGSLPEDISLRLSKLIERGNRYSCQIHSVSNKHCNVFLKETYQSPENRNYHSFVSNFQPGEDDNIGEDLLLLADESPLNLGDDDTDSSEK